MLGCNWLCETLLSLYEFKRYCDLSLRLCESEKSLSEIVQVCVMFGKDCASLQNALSVEFELDCASLCRLMLGRGLNHIKHDIFLKTYILFWWITLVRELLLQPKNDGRHIIA